MAIPCCQPQGTARVWSQVSPDPESLSMLSSSLETGRIAFLSLEIPACFSPQEYTAHLISEFRLLKTTVRKREDPEGKYATFFSLQNELILRNSWFLCLHSFNLRVALICHSNNSIIITIFLSVLEPNSIFLPFLGFMVQILPTGFCWFPLSPVSHT